MLSYDFPGSFRNGKYAEDNSGQERTKSGRYLSQIRTWPQLMCCAARHLLVLNFGWRENTSGAK